MPSDYVPRDELACAHFEIGVVSSGARRFVRVEGELDLVTSEQLVAVVRRVRLDTSQVVLNLEQLTFVDSTGVQSILECRELCRRSHTGFALTAPGPQIRRVFQIAGLLDQFDFVDSGGAAIRDEESREGLLRSGARLGVASGRRPDCSRGERAG